MLGRKNLSNNKKMQYQRQPEPNAQGAEMAGKAKVAQTQDAAASRADAGKAQGDQHVATAKAQAADNVAAAKEQTAGITSGQQLKQPTFEQRQQQEQQQQRQQQQQAQPSIDKETAKRNVESAKAQSKDAVNTAKQQGDAKEATADAQLKAAKTS